MSSRPKVIVDGSEEDNENLARTTAHGTRSVNARATPTNLHPNETARQGSPVQSASDRVDAEFLQQWEQAGGPQFLASHQDQHQLPRAQEAGPHDQDRGYSGDHHQDGTSTRIESGIRNEAQESLRVKAGEYRRSRYITRSKGKSSASSQVADDFRHETAQSEGEQGEIAFSPKHPTGDIIDARIQVDQGLQTADDPSSDNAHSQSMTKAILRRSPRGSKAVNIQGSKRPRKGETGPSADVASVHGEDSQNLKKRCFQGAESLEAESQQPAKSSLVQRLQEGRTKAAATSRRVKRPRRKVRRAQPTDFDETDTEDGSSHEPRLSNVEPVSTPGYPQADTAILNPYALGLASAQGSGQPCNPVSTGIDSVEQSRAAGGHLGQLDAEGRAQQPQKIEVNESEVDTDAAESDGVPLVQRSQRGTKKEGSEDVAKRRMGKDKKLKGEVRRLKDGSGKAFRDAKNPRWTKYESSQEPYTVEPASGHAATDVTSRCTDQKDWASDLVETICDPRGRNLLAGNYRPGDFLEKNPPDWILEDGTVVLDLNGHPVRKFRNVPSTLSSEIEPARLEGLRNLNGMTINDLIARMPKYCETSDGKLQALQGPSAFTNRAKHWRARQNMQPLKKGRPRNNIPEGLPPEQSGHGLPKRAPNDEESHDAGRTKRPRLGADDPFDNQKGTVAQRTAVQIRKQPARKARRGAQVQAHPDSASDQPSDSVNPYSMSGNSTDPQPFNEAESRPLVAPDGSYSGRDPMADFEGFFINQFPLPQPTVDPSLIDHNPADQLTYGQQPFPSPDFTTPALTRGPSTQDHLLNSPQMDNGPYIPNEPPESMRGTGMQLPYDGTTQSGDHQTTHYPPVPDPANSIVNVYPYPGSTLNVRPNQPSLYDQSSGISTQVQVVPLYDFRDHHPRSNEELLEIQQALWRTLDSFGKAHPEEATPPIVWTSYNESWTILEARHRELCEASGSRVTPLAGLGPWYHALENWPSAMEM